MLILSDKWITTKCQPPDLRAWVADRAAVARLGPDNPAAASGTSHHPPPSPRADRLLLWVLLDQKLTPTPLAAAVVYAPFQVVRVFRQQGVGGPGGVRPATRPGILPRFRHQPGLQGVALDVATATQEISLALDGRTLETTLPEVAHEAIAPIEVVDVGATYPTATSTDPRAVPVGPGHESDSSSNSNDTVAGRSVPGSAPAGQENGGDRRHRQRSAPGCGRGS